MAVGGIGGNGGSPSAVLALRLALRQAQPGGGAAAGAGAEAPAAAAAPATPDAVLQDVAARAQFTASIRVAQAAVEQAGAAAQSYDPASATPA